MSFCIGRTMRAANVGLSAFSCLFYVGLAVAMQAGDAAADDLVLRDEEHGVVEERGLGGVLGFDRFHVLAEAAFSDGPVGDGEIILGAVGGVFGAAPVAVDRGVVLVVEGFLRGFALARVENKLRHAEAVAHEFRLIGAHVVGDGVLRLAGRVALENAVP
jgi:hypothetical protein